jgi:hypothetical protein
MGGFVMSVYDMRTLTIPDSFFLGNVLNYQASDSRRRYPLRLLHCHLFYQFHKNSPFSYEFLLSHPDAFFKTSLTVESPSANNGAQLVLQDRLYPTKQGLHYIAITLRKIFFNPLHAITQKRTVIEFTYPGKVACVTWLKIKRAPLTRIIRKIIN